MSMIKQALHETVDAIIGRMKRHEAFDQDREEKMFVQLTREAIDNPRRFGATYWTFIPTHHRTLFSVVK
jgi:hypothetical protein